MSYEKKTDSHRMSGVAVQDLPPPAERRRHQPTQGSGEPILIERQYRQVCRTLTISMTSLILKTGLLSTLIPASHGNGTSTAGTNTRPASK